MRKNLDDQRYLAQLRELDERLHEVVPKVAELNTICREMGRDNIFYEPQILTEVKSDGTKVSKVCINVFPDRTDRDENG